MTPTVATSPLWGGRDDGPGPEHRRWHQIIAQGRPTPGGVTLIGFRSDEGVRRNHGRVGAADGSRAIRAAMASMAVRADLQAADLGNVEVIGDALEQGQAQLSARVRDVLDAGSLPIVLGGGHETAFGTYAGLRNSRLAAGKTIGILNIDAHFDLRASDRPTSGTPFRQIAEEEEALGYPFKYGVLGINPHGNTHALFRTAEKYGVRYLLDEDCTDAGRARAFAEEFIDSADLLYLTVDLDVLPAQVAPGVSAPAALGVPLATVLDVCHLATGCGKLAAADVVELNPRFDIDNRTSRVAARIVATIADASPTEPRHESTRRTIRQRTTNS